MPSTNDESNWREELAQDLDDVLAENEKHGWSQEGLALQKHIDRAEHLDVHGAPMGNVTRNFVNGCKRLLEEKYHG